MEKPTLVILAAGMGSRYGGLKQIDPVDEYGNIIMDFSIYDAVRAGFEKVVFIIKKENEDSFREAVGNRMAKYMEVSYVFQDINNIPEGFEVPEGRVKPWGTGQAVLACKDVLKEPFMRSTGHLLLSMQMIIMEDMRLKQFIIICLSMRMMISIVMRWSDIF